MVRPDRVRLDCLCFLLLSCLSLAAQDTGSLRGIVEDADFEMPLAGVKVQVAETGQTATTSDQGNYLISGIAPGTYTIIISQEGYQRFVKGGVVMTANGLREVNASLTGSYEDLEEFVVEDALRFSPGSESSTLELRFNNASLLDAIGSDFIIRAGASDAAGAVRLIAGATVKDGKSAVIRGLPDRYVSSQLNGVRLPTADEDKRAVELDQFPSVLLERVAISKTFTPDQQGDASGGAVNVMLKRASSEQLYFSFRSQIGFNSQVTGKKFLGYEDSDLGFFGQDAENREPPLDLMGMSWPGAVGTSIQSTPTDYKWSIAVGGNHQFDDDLSIGGFATFFYERDSSSYDNGIDDSYWVANPGEAMTPAQNQIQGSDDYRTSLFDITRGSRQIQWGALASFGVKWKEQVLDFTYLSTHTTEDVATLAQDTRGKQYAFPGYDPSDPTTPGHAEPSAAPYIRFETLQYTERSTDSFQIHGEHKLPTGAFGIFSDPELDWTLAFSSAALDQPDKRQFGAEWRPASEPFPGFVIPAVWTPYKPDANFTLGGLQRIWKTINEDSEQIQINLKLPFSQWDDLDGAVKLGFFSDAVDREFDQDTYSNFNDNSNYQGEFSDPWSSVFPMEEHPITEALVDVDYVGALDVEAFYLMLDLPVTEELTFRGGLRLESTELGIINDPEEEATWYPQGAPGSTQINPDDVNIAFEQSDLLPSFSLEYKPIEDLTLRAAYNETIARQTFKEVTPIIQQEFLGGPIFIGNPELGMSSVTNYDFRADYTPLPGGLLSFSAFMKEIEQPIEYVQRSLPFSFTFPVNYPEGSIKGLEFEARQDMGQLWEPLSGLTLGANATFMDSEVTIPQAERDEIFNTAGVMIPGRRDMTLAPDMLFNVFLTYDLESTGTRFSVFYTIQGDSLLSGAGISGGNYLPSVYATSYDNLNVSLTQDLGEHFQLKLEAKNLTNPDVETVYRDSVIGSDTLKTSFSRGVDFAISLKAEFRF